MYPATDFRGQMLGVQTGHVPDLRAAEQEREVMVSGPGGPFYLIGQMMTIKAALGKLAGQERKRAWVCQQPDPTVLC